MPTHTGTKKAIQEIARVFNKLASELTSDLNQAVKEIESLKREVHRLKASQNKNAKSFPTTRANKRTPRTKDPGVSSTTGTSTNSHSSSPGQSHHETHHETPKPSHEPSFVFPSEPFNPSPSPEPSSPSNN